ncbi:hypothetical protein MYX06_02330 [Patescibacteria group bacterium AH-259-L05]|nr:hypothetical protein [Patescibacteria group bacterium AH-259-L05]
MTKVEKIWILLEIVRLNRYQAYINHFKTQFFTIDESVREKFAELYCQGLERSEDTLMAKDLKMFNRYHEFIIDRLITSSSGSKFKRSIEPTPRELMDLMMGIQKVVSRQKIAN